MKRRYSPKKALSVSIGMGVALFLFCATPLHAFTWTDGNTLDSSDHVRKTHIDEIIQNLLSLYTSKCGTYTPPSFTGVLQFSGGSTQIQPGVTPIRAEHIANLQAAVNQLYGFTHGGASCPGMSAAPTPWSTFVRAAYINELRACLDSVEAGPACSAVGPCGQAVCYKCAGNSCVQDNANGTFTASNCNNACNGNSCGNGNCQTSAGENSTNCPQDCGTCTDGPTTTATAPARCVGENAVYEDFYGCINCSSGEPATACCPSASGSDCSYSGPAGGGQPFCQQNRCEPTQTCCEGAGGTWNGSSCQMPVGPCGQADCYDCAAGSWPNPCVQNLTSGTMTASECLSSCPAGSPPCTPDCSGGAEFDGCGSACSVEYGYACPSPGGGCSAVPLAGASFSDAGTCEAYCAGCQPDCSGGPGTPTGCGDQICSTYFI